MAQRIGLEAVLEDAAFKRGLRSYLGGLNEMSSQTSRTASSLSSQFKGLGDTVLSVASKMGTALVAGAAAAGAAVVAFTASGVKGAANLEQQVADIASVMNKTSGEIAPLKDLIVDLGLDPRLKVTATEAAEAIELLARNGLSMTEIMEGAAFSTVLLANATGTNFGNAANIATDAMAIFGKEASDMEGVVDGIVSVTTNSKFTIDDYSLALRNGGAAAADMGISLTEFNAVIAASAEELGSGMRAGTGFRNFITRLTPKTKPATAAMRDLGLITADGTNQFFNASGEMRSMSEIAGVLDQALNGTTTRMVEVGGRTAEQNALLAELQKAYGSAEEKVRKYELGILGATLSDSARNKAIQGQQAAMANLAPQIEELLGIRGDLVETTDQLTDAERSAAIEAIFGADAMGTVLALSNETEDGFLDLMAAMGETDAVQNAATRMDTLSGKIEIAQGVIEALAMRFGEIFLPIITGAVEKVTGVLEKLTPIIDQVSDALQALSEGNVEEFFYELEHAWTTAFMKFKFPVELFAQVRDSIRDVRDGIAEGKPFLEIFGDVLNNFIPEDTVSKITGAIQFIIDHIDEIKGAIMAIGALAAGAGIASLIASILALVNPLTAVIAVVGLLGAAWAGNWGDIQGKTQRAINFIRPKVEAFLDALRKFWEKNGQAIIGFVTNLAQIVIDKWLAIKDIFTSLWEALQALFAGDFEGFGQRIGDAVMGAIQMIFDQLLGMAELIIPILVSLWETISAWFTEQDWGAHGNTIVTAIVAALKGFASVVIPQLVEWGLALAGWFTENWPLMKEWGIGIVTAVIEGLQTFVSTVVPALASWLLSIVNWTENVDWYQIGYNITTFIVTGLMEFGANVAETLMLWWETFTTWVETVEWETLGTRAIESMKVGLAQFWEIVSETIETWWTSFETWFDGVEWDTLAERAIKGIKDGLAQFWETVKDTVGEWWQAIKSWFERQDWKAMGTSIIDGIKKGLDPAGLLDAMGGLARGARDAFADAIGYDSPAKEFIKIGTGITQGLNIGLTKSESGILNTMGNIASDMMNVASPILDPAMSPNVVVQGGSSTTQNNYNLTTQTSQTSQNVRNQFRLMEAVGA